MDLNKLNKDFRMKLIGISIVLVTFLLGYCMNTQSQNSYAQKVKAYLNSPEFKQDFQRKDSGIEQDVLVIYPKITIYITFKYNSKKEFSEEEKYNANQQKCDFVSDLFTQFKANGSQKTAILNLLRQDNIVIENIYRNKYADVLFTTQQPLAECTQWYPHQSDLSTASQE